ncbi:hypothetical protein O9G_005252 [Rozella allomycis CSF55]|uniref:ATP-dependent DNA helicase n=1 Tax=Rozella allomycis (strain CSF55) TaxID=988480 RepID=A0A075AYZ0_ROZAC|nr:hypothetical protein O9G_005252 [Rozella allomycis CSF55]|eukprot:EPZ33769.1 hypothetical protein O9G_005252 [Rozella allomycis CSF55]
MDILKEKKTKERDKDTMEGQTSTSVVNIKDAFKQKDAVVNDADVYCSPEIRGKLLIFGANIRIIGTLQQKKIRSLELVVPTPDQKLRISVVISDLTSHFYDKCDEGDTIVTAGELRVSGEKRYLVCSTIGVAAINASFGSHADTKLNDLSDIKTSYFGGYPLVMVGDFRQLGPPSGNGKCLMYNKQLILQSKSYLLTKCFRGLNDAHFYSLLQDNLFRASIDHRLVVALQTLCQHEKFKNAPTLTSLKKTVEAENDKYIQNRMGHIVSDIYFAMDYLPNVEAENDKYIQNRRGHIVSDIYFAMDYLPNGIQSQSNIYWPQTATQLPNCLKLTIGIQVMFTVNVDHTIRNGIFGYVVTLNKDLIQIIVPGLGKVNVTRLMKTVSHSGHYRIQFPIMVCTFMTIHKSMGLNLPKVNLYLVNLFEPGQLLVALSRCRSRNDICVLDCNLEFGKLTLRPKDDIIIHMYRILFPGHNFVWM